MKARIRRMGIGVLSGVLMATAAGRAEATVPWSLVSCDPAGAAGWQAFENQMRAAKPGSPNFVPVPFPTTSDQVVQDYLYQYWSVIKKLNPKTWPPNEARVQADLKSGKVSYQVLRAENWTVSRCRPNQKRDFYQLVRVFEPGGTEVTRAVINDSGLMTTWNDMPASVPGLVASQSRTLPPAETAMAQLNAQLGIAGVDAEYVVTYGSFSCLFTHPCLAFHQAGLSYLAFGDQLFEISVNSPRFKLWKDVAGTGELSLMREISAAGERLISLGGVDFSVARQVEVATVRRKQSVFAR